jgi:hypothetical protein
MPDIENEKPDQYRYAEPDEVKQEVETWAWLMGNLPNDNTMSDDDLVGIYYIGNMIAKNVAYVIDKLQTENHDLRKKLGPKNET